MLQVASFNGHMTVIAIETEFTDPEQYDANKTFMLFPKNHKSNHQPHTPHTLAWLNAFLSGG